MEQRYHAVMEVIAGAPVTEVAVRYGVSRQAVHTWLAKYKKDGLAGLADHSHRPHSQLRQIHADVEAVISQLRGAHPRWGPRRLQFELGKAGVSPVPSRSTVYRVLVRHGLVAARKRKRRAPGLPALGARGADGSCGSWTSSGRVFLTDGTELKIVIRASTTTPGSASSRRSSAAPPPARSAGRSPPRCGPTGCPARCSPIFKLGDVRECRALSGRWCEAFR